MQSSNSHFKHVPHDIHSPDLPRTTTVRNHPDESRRLTPLLTVDQAAELLSVSPTTVYRLVDRQELVVHRVGRGLRFSRADLDAFLARRRSNVTQHERPKDQGLVVD